MMMMMMVMMMMVMMMMMSPSPHLLERQGVLVQGGCRPRPTPLPRYTPIPLQKADKASGP
jgi:hypothetical protein